jgi:hypothetical protein
MARGRQTSLVVVLSPQERETLERWQRATTMAAGLARRGRIILLLAEGHAPSQVAQWVGGQRGVVRQGATRFLAHRLDGLADPPGRGATGGFFPGGRGPRGAAGLRAPRSAGASPLPVGWRRTGASAHRRGARGGHFRRHRATPSARAAPPTLAASGLASPQAAAGCRLLCHHGGVDRPLRTSPQGG